MGADQKKPTRRQKLHSLVLALHVTAGVYGFFSGITLLGSAQTPLAAAAGILRLVAGALLLSALFTIQKTKTASRLLMLLVVLQASAGLLSAVSNATLLWHDMVRQLLSDGLMIAVMLVIRLERQ